MSQSNSGAVARSADLRRRLEESLAKVNSLNRDLRAEISRSKKLQREYDLALENLSQLPLPFYDDTDRVSNESVSGR